MNFPPRTGCDFGRATPSLRHPQRANIAKDQPRQQSTYPSRNPVQTTGSSSERRVGAIRPSVVLGAVVGGIHDDGVVGDAQLIELGEQPPTCSSWVTTDRCSRPARSCRGSWRRGG